MKRRDVLRHGVAAMAASVLASGTARAAQAVGHGCFNEKPGQVRCQVGFPSAPYIEPQACRSVCWANCVAYILRGYGAKISIETVVQRLETPGDCRLRDDASIIMGAGGLWRDDTGRAFLVSVERYGDIQQGSFTIAEFEPLVHALARRPVIVGEAGHSMILTQMTYVDAPMVMMRHDRLTLRDPWMGTPNLRKLGYEDAPEKLFAIGLNVRKL